MNNRNLDETESRTEGLPTINKLLENKEAGAGVTLSPAENRDGYSGPSGQPILPVKKRGNPNLVKGGPSLNPFGGPKKPITKASKVRQGMYDVFLNAGGPDRLERQMKELKPGRTKESRKRAEEHDIKFYKFGTETIPKILPKEVFEDKEERILVFKFSDGTQETLKSSREEVVDVEVQK